MEFLSNVHPEKNGRVFKSIKFTLERPKFTVGELLRAEVSWHELCTYY